MYFSWPSLTAVDASEMDRICPCANSTWPPSARTQSIIPLSPVPAGRATETVLFAIDPPADSIAQPGNAARSASRPRSLTWL